MLRDGIKVARIQAQYAPLNKSTWTVRASPKTTVLGTIKHAAARMNPHRGGRRRPGRHAAPGRTLLSRHASRLRANAFPPAGRGLLRVRAGKKPAGPTGR